MSRRKKEQAGEQQIALTREKFEARFRRYTRAQPLLKEVSAKQMDMFFAIAEQYRRDALNLPAIGENRQLLLDDAKNSKALMTGITRRLGEIQRLISESSIPEHVATTTLAQYASDQLASFRQELEKEFEFEQRRIEAKENQLSATSAQHAELEFTLDLLGFIRDSFPKLTDAKKRRLAEAAMAGAGSFTESELKQKTQLGRVRMKFLRAKKYLKEMYPEGRVYPHLKLLGKKKQEAAAGERKKE